MCISHSKNVQILRHTKHVEVSSNLPSVTSKINTSDIESIIHTGKKLKTVWHFLLSTFQKHTRKETEKGTNLQKLRIHLEKFGDLNSCTECTLKLQSVLHGSCKVVPYYIFSETTVGHVRKHWTLFGIVGCQAKQSESQFYCGVFMRSVLEIYIRSGSFNTSFYTLICLRLKSLCISLLNFIYF